MKIQQKPQLIYGMMTAIVLLYYRWTWQSVGNFVSMIDYCETLSCDFVKSYYPTSKTIFTTAEPWINYIYASLFAVVLHPISLLPIEWAAGLWIILQVLLAGIFFKVTSEYFLHQTYRYLYFFILISSFPVLHNFKWGQVSMLITTMVVASFWLYDRKQKCIAAILLSFTIALKFYSLVFLFIYILKKDWKTFWICIACVIAFVFVVPALTMGYRDYLKFYSLSKIQFVYARPRWRLSEDSEYIANVLMRYFYIFKLPKPNWELFRVGGYFLTVVQMIGLGRLHRYKKSLSTTQMMCGLFLLGPLWVETSWPHYFVYLPFCQMLILCWHHEKNESLPIRVSVFASVFLASIFCFNLFPNWVPYNGFGLIFFANMILVICFWIMATRNQTKYNL